jgi:hypothetical protein
VQIKGSFFLSQRNINDPQMTIYSKKYCRILTSVIKLAKKKKRSYNSILTCSKNKTKIIWNIVKNTSNMQPNTHNITAINMNGKVSPNGQIIAETFNKYFVSIAQKYMRITTMLMLYLIMKILYPTYPGHLLNNFQLLILNVYNLQKQKI